MANSHRDNLRVRICMTNEAWNDTFNRYLIAGYCNQESRMLADKEHPTAFVSTVDWRRAFYAPKGKRISYSERNRSMRAKARVACRDACRGDYHKADTLDRPTTLWW